jgi:hypothetical protein
MKISWLTKEHTGIHGDSNCPLKHLIIKHYKNVVNEEPGHLFNVNFRVFVRGVGVMDNKIRM